MTRTKMYKMTTGKKDNEIKVMIKDIELNMHPSLTAEGRKEFERVYARETARAELAKIQCKIDNGMEDDVDYLKRDALRNEFDFDENTDFATFYYDAPDEIIPLLILTLYAHDNLIESYSQDPLSKEWSIKRDIQKLNQGKFYVTAKNAIIDLHDNRITRDEAIKLIRPLYNEATKLVNHAESGTYIKHWQESTKTKAAAAFFDTLNGTYKLTRSNYLDLKSPLKSLNAFEKYLLAFLVSDATVIDKSKKQDVPESMDEKLAKAKAWKEKQAKEEELKKKVLGEKKPNKAPSAKNKPVEKPVETTK